MPKESFIPDQHMDTWSSLSLVEEFQSFSNGHCLLHNGLSFSAKGLAISMHGHAEIHQVMDPPLPQVVKHHGRQIIGIPVSRQNENPSSSNTSLALTHMRLGPKISETVKGKLSLGARILQLGGVKRVFKQIFGIGEGEKLLKASQCYLSTTAGPLAGLLFISTQRVAFAVRDQSNSLLQMVNWLDSITRWVTHLTLSLDLSLPVSPSPCFLSSKRKSCFVQVSIPLRKVKRVDPSENVKNPSQKYMEIVTLDNFDFWFIGFLNYQKSFNCLQQALSQS
ncbi:GEM-like protein 4 [Vitis vinifera]|uniref:GEM-like protein 4 n=1 Tax=Vitis vinifera TaxID=29760 RepID=A0A438EUS7_VITVI|nr:GEM-like protein 4 [Vitis vinifera]